MHWISIILAILLITPNFSLASGCCDYGMMKQIFKHNTEEDCEDTNNLEFFDLEIDEYFARYLEIQSLTPTLVERPVLHTIKAQGNIHLDILLPPPKQA